MNHRISLAAGGLLTSSIIGIEGVNEESRILPVVSEQDGISSRNRSAIPEPRHRLADFLTCLARCSENDVTMGEGRSCGSGRFRYIGLQVVYRVLILRVDLSIAQTRYACRHQICPRDSASTDKATEVGEVHGTPAAWKARFSHSCGRSRGADRTQSSATR